jgi:MazG family protein
MNDAPTPRPLELPPATGDARLDALARVLAIVDRLRDPGGCPWDREQTLGSMAPSLIEEAFEAVEAIERGDAQGTAEELGDLLLVIALIARIAAEERRFDLRAAAEAVGDKLIRRHPHVFGDVRVESAEHALANWERIKQGERREKRADASALAGVPLALPALQRAQRLGAKAISAGFRWSDARGAFRKLEEEVAELRAELERAPPDRSRLESELGDVLLAAAQLGNYLELDPERAAREALRRFEARFRRMEESLGTRLSERSLAELLAAWEAAR